VGLLDMFDMEQKRQMFFASIFLSFLFIVSCLSRLILWLLTGFLVFCSVYLAYILFMRKEERNRLKRAFGSGKDKVRMVKE
jgi:protein-S-isoprenylcysteine O-methyltransferase Ste14